MEFLLVASQNAVACLGKGTQCAVQAQPVALPSLSGHPGAPRMGRVQPKIGPEWETGCVLAPSCGQGQPSPKILQMRLLGYVLPLENEW